MVIVVLLVCSLVQPYGCFQIKDNLGPYTTRQECFNRANEIRNNWVVPLHFPAGFKCVTPGEGV
tara:strand:+ start:296 stop:487 length:192 start_codon:yes stop_codon:yes gene_type:complete